MSSEANSALASDPGANDLCKEHDDLIESLREIQRIVESAMTVYAMNREEVLRLDMLCARALKSSAILKASKTFSFLSGGYARWRGIRQVEHIAILTRKLLRARRPEAFIE